MAFRVKSCVEGAHAQREFEAHIHGYKIKPPEGIAEPEDGPAASELDGGQEQAVAEFLRNRHREHSKFARARAKGDQA